MGVFGKPNWTLCGVWCILWLFSGTAYGQDTGAPPGIQLYQNQDYPGALSQLEDWTTTHPNDAQAWYFLGLTHNQLKSYPSAVDALKQALALDPALTRAYLDLGIAYYHLKEFEQALETLRKAAQAQPDSGAIAMFLGLCHQALEHYQDALPFFERARELDPDFRQLSFFNTGLVHFKLKRSGESRKALQQAIRDNPDSQTAELARKLLESLEQQTPERNWGVSAHTGWSYDDNVTLSDINFSSGVGDALVTFDFSAHLKEKIPSGPELQVSYDFFQSIYETLSTFDLQIHTFSFDAAQAFGELNGSMGYTLSYISLGGEKFEAIHTVNPSIGFEVAPFWYFQGTYAFSQKEFFNIPDRDGQNHSLTLAHYFFPDFASLLLWATYTLEGENTRGNAFDYFAHNAGVGGKLPLKFLSDQTYIQTGYYYYFRDYETDTPFIGREREDERHLVDFSLATTLLGFLEGKITYQYINSISNLPFNDFRENIVGVSVGMKY